MTEAIAQSQRYTYGDYCQWPDDECWELIEGVPYAMTPAPGWAHQTLVTELSRQIGNFLEGKPCQVLVAPFDVRLPDRNEADEDIVSVVQPDILVICDESKLDEQGCRGAPDWVIEVLSPATAAKDQIQKLALYEKHGVKEYWLVHPTDRVVSIYRLGPDGRYGRPEIAETKGVQSVDLLEGLQIDWDQVFSRL